ncbi:histidine phosphatase family protein [Psychrobacillus lasiicapitis]|uniref:Histidine phosphatase family protein n=1 Tax=Psychrobacillus lasiicapitis TaxID=1636719 RepID=A0A544TH23_9BACI|nr:histidine phosphatase family protein [Psychrobacillus lasiicapitis]TQR16680.1 histidine phosphatase family protein [Psychrobacillus lasiicapitis]GGA28110.1 phosphoglycerate mutase [Psychrobacillus lasiicapitis]
MKRIYIIRHCKAEGQEENANLTSEGYNQAMMLRDYFENMKIDKIISSPYVRAVQSIKPLAESKEMDIIKDARLSERILSTANYSNWLEKLKMTFQDKSLTFLGGESSDEALCRISLVLEEVINSSAEDVILVTHGAIMSLLLNSMDEGFSFEQWQSLSNPDIYLIEVLEGERTFKRIWK